MKAAQTTTGPLPQMAALVPVQWDEHARKNAYDQQKALADDDPDAAAYLMAHLRSAAHSAPTAPRPRPSLYPDPEDERGYNATRIYAQVSAARGWTPQQIDDVHFPLLFGLLREWTILAEQEQAEQDARMEALRNGRDGAPLDRLDRTPGSLASDPDIAEIMRYAKRPRTWNGG